MLKLFQTLAVLSSTFILIRLILYNVKLKKLLALYFIALKRALHYPSSNRDNHIKQLDQLFISALRLFMSLSLFTLPYIFAVLLLDFARNPHEISHMLAVLPYVFVCFKIPK